MRLALYCVGRLSADWLRAGVAEYESRIRRYLPWEVHELREEKSGRKLDPARIREGEGARLLERLDTRSRVIVLDERGRAFTSEQLAGLLNRHMVEGTPELALVIGGAYGLAAAVRERAELQLSLSPMTLTHQMARLLLCEQLYRGLTILRNEPYHNR